MLIVAKKSEEMEDQLTVKRSLGCVHALKVFFEILAREV